MANQNPTCSPIWRRCQRFALVCWCFVAACLIALTIIDEKPNWGLQIGFTLLSVQIYVMTALMHRRALAERTSALPASQ